MNDLSELRCLESCNPCIYTTSQPNSKLEKPQNRHSYNLAVTDRVEPL